MGISTIERFGQISSEEPLYNVHRCLSLDKYIVEDLIGWTTNRLTSTSSGVTLDVSSILDPYGDEVDPFVASGYEAVVYMLFDRRTQTKVTLDYCNTSDGEAYSQQTSFASHSTSGPMIFRWQIRAENYENNCKLKFTTSSSCVIDYTIIALYQYKAPTE